MSGEVQGVLVAVTGVVAVQLVLTDAYLAYLKSSMGPPLLVAGVVLTVLGLLTILRAVRADRADVGEHPDHADGSHHDDHDGHGHDHEGHSPKVAWLLLLPLLAILLVAPAPLGAYAAGRNDSQAPPEVSSRFAPLAPPVDGAVELTLTDFLQRAFYDDTRSLEGVAVRLSGFVVADPDNPTGYLLTRFVLSCCAADGFPVQVAIAEVDGAPPPDDTWVEVTGTWAPPDPDAPPADNGGPADAVLVAATQTEIDPPVNPYE